MNEDLGKEMGWDDQIDNDGQSFELLPEGTYEFTVESMERGRFPGSDKLSPCHTAALTLEIRNPETGNICKVFDTLYLNSKREWRLGQFFLCIGQKKKGEPLRPNWAAVPGASGKAEIEVNQYTDKNGNTRKNNRIRTYLPYEPKKYEAGKF